LYGAIITALSVIRR